MCIAPLGSTVQRPLGKLMNPLPVLVAYGNRQLRDSGIEIAISDGVELVPPREALAGVLDALAELRDALAGPPAGEY